MTVIPFPDLLPAFTNRAVDAAFPIEPFITLGEGRGAFRCWQYTGELWPRFQIGVLLYGPTFAVEREASGRRFLVAYVRALRDYYRAFFGDGVGRAELLALLAQHTAIKDLALLERLAPNGIDPDGAVDLDSLRAVQRWYVEKGAITAEADLDEVVDHHFLDYATQRLGRYPR